MAQCVSDEIITVTLSVANRFLTDVSNVNWVRRNFELSANL